MPDESLSTEDFLFQARQRFSECAADEKSIREQATQDLNFVAGNQWRADIENDRTAKGRLCLKFNRCHTFVQQVSNEARQNKPQIKFVVGDGGDKDTAEVKEGMARHIQYSSDAQVAYETAVEYSAGGSFGYFGFITEYCNDNKGYKANDPRLWDQDLKVRTFADPFAVYGILIPSIFGMEPPYGFVVEEMPKEEYKRQHGTKEIEAVGGWEEATKRSQGWIGTETVRIAEYWYLEHEEQTITRKNPDTGEDETRTVDRCKVKFCKLDGLRVLPGTETEWEGYCIPIVPVIGKQLIIDGKPSLFSVVRFQRDPQQLINYYKTRIAETLSTAPIQPYMVAKGQIAETDKAKWGRMNMELSPYLEYTPVDVNGKEVGPPQRQVFEAPINSLSEASAQEIDDMKAVTGIYDASLGNKSNEQSGLAIQRRQQQSNITNMHFMDNLERAFKKGGLIIADLLPKIYDAKREVQILGADEMPKIVKINHPHTDQYGKEKHYKVADSDSDVPIVTMGRAFASKRMETFDMMSSVLQANPQLIEVIGDVFFQNSDLAGADIMAGRFKRYINIKYPGLIDDKDADPQTQIAQMQAQMAASQQATQAMQQELQKLQMEREAKVIEHQSKERIAQAEILSKENIIKMQEVTKIAVAQINASKDANEGIADREAEAYQLFQEHAHDAAITAQEQAHQKELADQQHQQALEQGAQAGAIQAANQVSASPVNGSGQ